MAAILLRRLRRPSTLRAWLGYWRFGKYRVAQMRILLVEDHPESRRALQRLIERRGHEVVAVSSAEEAEVELKKHAFPFLILDWMLPGKSGVELCRELRSGPNGEELFILLVTARDDPEDLKQALEA